MADKIQKPKIRFKGYANAWEQRKLGEISEIKTGPFGSTLHADDYVSEGVPIITTEHFKTGSLPQSASGLPQVSEVDYKRLSAYTLNNGDIVFSRVGSVDINALVTPFQRNWLFSGRVLRVRPGIDVLPQFLHTRLETESIKNDICARAVGQTMPSINTEILKATQLVLPTSMAEQKKIGLCFSKLDHLITLHQQKYDTLQILKKAMLDKMFPKNGSSVPEIRFKEFTGAWEQRTFDEMASYKKGPFGSALKKEIFVPDSDDSVKVYEQQNAINKDWKLERYYITKRYANELNAFETHGGDILVSCAGTIGEIYELPLDARSGVINQALMRVRVNEQKVRKGFYKLLFNNMMEDFSKEHSNGSAMKNIPPFADLKPMITLVPSMEEQAKIDECFTNLDTLISLHQHKLDTLKNFKKAMLEKMFV